MVAHEEKANNPNDFESLTASQKEILLDWCDLIGKISTINKKHSSYGLKHIFEKSKNGFYVTNGMFKGAMLKLEYEYELCHPTSPNWYFNISEKGIKFLIHQNELNKNI